MSKTPPRPFPYLSTRPNTGHIANCFVRFSRKKRLLRWKARIQQWADRLIDAVKADGQCEFVDAVGSRFPVSVFMEMLGLSMDRFDEFRSLVSKNFEVAGTPAAMEAQMAIVGVLAEFVKERQAEPKDDMMSHIIRSDFEGRSLSYEELLSIAHLLFLAGLDTVVNALSFSMKHLAGRRRIAAAYPRRSRLHHQCHRRIVAPL